MSRIVILCDGVFPYEIGGMQKHTQMLTRHLLLQDISVTLVHGVYNKEIPAENEVFEKVIGSLNADRKLFRSIAIQFPEKGIFPGHYVRNSYRFSKSVYKAAHDEINNAELVYIQGFAGWHCLKNKKSFQKRTKFWINFHGYNMFQRPYSFRNYLESFILRKPVIKNILLADKVISLGGAITTILLRLGISKEKIVIQPNGIDESWMIRAPLPETEKEVKNILFIGRNDKIKGFDLLRKIMNEPAIKNRLFFHIIGDFNGESNTEVAVFYGRITNEQELIKIIDSCDALLMLSHSEGLPTVILETMARAKPVISTEVGAIPEIVNSKNGLLLKRLPSKELASGIMSFLTGSQSELRRNALETAKKYTWPAIIKSMIRQVENE